MMTGENETTETGGEGNDPYLGTWKDKESAVEGLSNMQSKLDSQGNEVGDLRKQVEFAYQTIEDMKSQRAAQTTSTTTDGTNYEQELADVQKQMLALDPVDENFQKDNLELMTKSNEIASKAAHERTLAAATAAFKKELDERDIKATHNSFYNENPDFNTPEMQMKIKEYIARDKSGMSDPLVAYREIQRDTVAAKATQLEQENEELKKIAELAKGANSTGRVVTKVQSAPQTKPITTGADRDQGMQAALDALRG